jgi:predicted MFS family arabinose efflux permease
MIEGATRTSRPTRDMLLLYAASVGGDLAFYLLLAAVPALASGADAAATAGTATFALMIGAVIGELAAPPLAGSAGQRGAFAGGLILLGLASIVLALSPGPEAVVAVSAVRGVGFGLTVVVAGSLAASLLSDDRRAEGLGLYGLVVGIPAIIGVPLGVQLAETIGAAPVALLGGAAALMSVPCVVLIQHDERQRRSSASADGARTHGLGRAVLPSAIAFASTTVAYGVLVTLLPVGGGTRVGGAAAGCLLLQSTATTVARWGSGRIHGHVPVIAHVIGGLAAVLAGTTLLVVAQEAAGLALAVVLFGAGFGAIQNVTLVVMFERVDRASFDAASAVWSVAYDGGMGAGGVIAAVSAVYVGAVGAYAAASLVVGATLIVAVACGLRIALSRPGRACCSGPGTAVLPAS